MQSIMEDMRNETELKNVRETTERTIRKGKMSLEEYAP